MSSKKEHLEYSRCHWNLDIRSTDSNLTSLVTSTPYVISNHTSGVLQMSWKSLHMECSICCQRLTSGVLIRTNFEALQMSSGVIQLEYSRCHLEKYIWSTPYVNYKCTSGALHMSNLECILYPREVMLQFEEKFTEIPVQIQEFTK